MKNNKKALLFIVLFPVVMLAVVIGAGFTRGGSVRAYAAQRDLIDGNCSVSRSQTCEWRTNKAVGPSSRGTSNAQAAPAAVSAQGNWADTGNPRIPANVAAWSESSWLKYHIAYLIEKDMYFLYPRVSLTTNFMSEGEHSREENQDLQVPLLMGGRGKYRFSEFSESEAVYDAFFENTGLKRIIGKIEKESFGNGLDSSFEDICIDLYGYRTRTAAINDKNRNENGSQSLTEQSRYVLTSASLPYRVIKSYGLSLRPIDLNIITEQPGEVFFLYDTKEAGPAPKVDRGRKYLYDYRALSLKKIAAVLKAKIRMRK